MKAQTRIGSLVESCQNILVGYAISVAATYFIGPFFGMKPNVGEVLGFGLVMTLISIARSYGIRRWNEFRRSKDLPPAFLYIVEELAAERHRQISGEGYSLAHDDEHANGELACGAAAYALQSGARYYADQGALHSTTVFRCWPWHSREFKTGTARRNLIKAGAMIIAEIGRIDRRRQSLETERASSHADHH